MGYPKELKAMVDVWQEDVVACRDEMQLISTRLESEGISVDIVYGLDVLERCIARMEAIHPHRR